MRFTKRFAASGIVMGVVALALAAASPSPARGAGSAPVTVMNGATQPVPVALQGTGAVAGTVNAQQNGAWTVGVSSLPAVQLAESTVVGVSNTPSSPVFMSDIAGRSAFAVFLHACSGAEGCTSGSSTVSPPVGTRFVIEQITGICTHGRGWLELRLNGQSLDHYLAVVPDNRPFSMPVRLYADGGLAGAIVLKPSNESNAVCSVTLSGYLIQMDAF